MTRRRSTRWACWWARAAGISVSSSPILRRRARAPAWCSLAARSNVNVSPAATMALRNRQMGGQSSRDASCDDHGHQHAGIDLPIVNRRGVARHRRTTRALPAIITTSPGEVGVGREMVHFVVVAMIQRRGWTSEQGPEARDTRKDRGSRMARVTGEPRYSGPVGTRRRRSRPRAGRRPVPRCRRREGPRDHPVPPAPPAGPGSRRQP
jgi:hypothetical protein